MKITKLDYTNKVQLVDYFLAVQYDFSPALFERIKNRSDVVSVEDYVEKLLINANVYAYFNLSSEIIAVIAIYTNDTISKNAYIPILSVKKNWLGKGLASSLVEQAIQIAKINFMKTITVKTWHPNTKAISLYSKFNFIIIEKDNSNVLFEKKLE